uniref:stonustoxin subunit alpha-like n=1 Tax=Gasterosteus aculeatus aculeatus TaxID=481459 RepID=UPI001A986136|nr:stonustoxin subunit alpha-like [Gasterosteus aculeatus aculeatus]
MATYLGTPIKGSTTEDEWFYSEEVWTSLRQKAKAFQDFNKAEKDNNRIRFFIAVIPNEKYKGATIYHYKQGILVSKDFTIPDSDPENITDRRDLILYACDLTLDPNTANGHIVLSDGNKKATNGSTWHQYPANPERFDSYNQVLCREGLSGRHYWEVDLDNASSSIYIRVAVAYKTMKTKGTIYESKFRNNTQSWALRKLKTNESRSLTALHNANDEWEFKPGGCSTLGVYLNWRAGTLSFYKVSSNTLTHLYTFHSTFTEPVYPGFWVYEQGYVYLRPL